MALSRADNTLSVHHLRSRTHQYIVKIAFFTTGGTIDKIYFDSLSDYEVGDPQVIDILAEAQVGFEYEVHNLFRKDSVHLTDEDRSRIRAEVEAEPSTQIIVTHGTDTMVETALALQNIAGKIIVLTGSLSPARFKTSDAEFNLGMAIAAVQSLPEGVYITMNGRIFEAATVRKNRTTNRFESV